MGGGLGLQLEPSELQLVVRWFSDGGEGSEPPTGEQGPEAAMNDASALLIDCDLFLQHFWALGKVEHPAPHPVSALSLAGWLAGTQLILQPQPFSSSPPFTHNRRRGQDEAAEGRGAETLPPRACERWHGRGGRGGLQLIIYKTGCSIENDGRGGGWTRVQPVSLLTTMVPTERFMK